MAGRAGVGFAPLLPPASLSPFDPGSLFCEMGIFTVLAAL